MKKGLIVLVAVIAAACSSPEVKDIDPTLEVSSETIEKIKEAQDANVELEEIDGELDSLIKNAN